LIEWRRGKRKPKKKKKNHKRASVHLQWSGELSNGKENLPKVRLRKKQGDDKSREQRRRVLYKKM